MAKVQTFRADGKTYRLHADGTRTSHPVGGCMCEINDTLGSMKEPPTDQYGRRLSRFIDVPVGTHFQIEPAMWGMVKRGWCWASQYGLEDDDFKFVWPWATISVNHTQQ